MRLPASVVDESFYFFNVYSITHMPCTNILNTLQTFISHCQTPRPDTVDSEEEKKEEEETENVRKCENI